jgi:hypothetical protein
MKTITPKDPLVWLGREKPGVVIERPTYRPTGSKKSRKKLGGKNRGGQRL